MSEKYNAYLNNQIGSGNYPLIPGNSQDVRTNNNVNQNNSMQNEMIIEYEKWGVVCYSIGFTFFILVILAILIYLITSDNPFIAVLILSIIVSVLVIALILFLILNTKHIKLIKNNSLNLLTVKKINFLNCEKSTFNLNLQNVIMDIIKCQITHKGHT